MIKKLFKPISIGNMELRNRIVFPPMTFDWANEDGTTTDRLIQHYATRAKGGAGLIRVESAAISRSGKTGPRNLVIDKDDFIPGLKTLTEAIHQHGAKASLQLVHCGKQGMPFVTGEQPVAPSAIPYQGCAEPRELSIPEIKKIIEEFSEGARRARDAGFDAIEFHGGHGFLINEFLSPYSNKRADVYGGDVLRRSRFAVEIVERTKAKCGRDFPVIFRMNGEDYYVAGGITLEESTIQARILERAGVDCFDISGGNAEFPVMVWQPACWPRSCFLHLADAIKKVINVPVITVGKIDDPILAEAILQEGKADLVAMGRALIADPELPNKAREGRFGDIRSCIRCMECGGSMWGSKDGGACSVNARFGHEYEKEYEITPSPRTRKVVVVGGGPAGMEAARVAALRGHEVTLYEGSDRLGGQMLVAKIPPHKEEIQYFTKFLSGQMKKLGVKVYLRKSVTPDLIKQVKPDVVIIATGGIPVVPDIPGIDQANVLMAREVLLGRKEPGERVLIIGGGRVGCELGEFLASKGKKVTIVKMREQLLEDMNPKSKEDLLNRLNMWGAVIQVHVKLQSITAQGIIADVEGKRTQLDAGSVIVAAGFKPNKELVEQLKNQPVEIYNIGDCENPGRILDAVRAGYQVGLKI
jgi:2,4-dienoyl-CoA reductase-like NADH-dependent reductase (Old Yellow Enzyme family)/thioredoxin reductase